MRKFDESAMCLGVSGEEAVLAVGGADGLVKVFQQDH